MAPFFLDFKTKELQILFLAFTGLLAICERDTKPSPGNPRTDGMDKKVIKDHVAKFEEEIKKYNLFK